MSNAWRWSILFFSFFIKKKLNHLFLLFLSQTVMVIHCPSWSSMSPSMPGQEGQPVFQAALHNFPMQWSPWKTCSGKPLNRSSHLHLILLSSSFHLFPHQRKPCVETCHLFFHVWTLFTMVFEFMLLPDFSNADQILVAHWWQSVTKFLQIFSKINERRKIHIWQA